MTVCFFGTYNPDYSRNRTLIRGLKENNIKVIEVNTDSNTKGIKKYLELIKLHHKIKHDYDVLLVAFPGFQTMIIAKLICRKKIVFDAFNSIYESTIIDRKLYSRRSLQALYYWLLNWLACVLADKIILDTNEHIKYFIKEFRIPKHKCYSIYVGTDDLIFYPQPKTTKQAKFLVHFHGSFIPLQGIEYILQAANILKSEEIQFNIIGKGQLYNKMILLAENLQLKNVKFIRFLAYEKLKDYIAEADISLGIFGNTAKAKRVIPNKEIAPASQAKFHKRSKSCVEIRYDRAILSVHPKKLALAIRKPNSISKRR